MITHWHGDHVLGIPGFLQTLALSGYNKTLHIYGPKGIKEITVLQLKLSKSWTKYQLIFHELESKESELIFEDEKVSVRTIPLDHRVYTNGFLFTEKHQQKKLDIEKIKQHPEIEICDYHNIKAGKDYVLESGKVIPNSELTQKPLTPKSYAFCSDTMYKPDIVPLIKESTLLYHESTFLKDREDLAVKTKHSTAEQAAKIAKEANVQELIIGHYSSRYPSIKEFKKEAEPIFKNVKLAEAGKTFTV